MCLSWASLNLTDSNELSAAAEVELITVLSFEQPKEMVNMGRNWLKKDVFVFCIIYLFHFDKSPWWEDCDDVS